MGATGSGATHSCPATVGSVEGLEVRRTLPYMSDLIYIKICPAGLPFLQYRSIMIGVKSILILYLVEQAISLSTGSMFIK